MKTPTSERSEARHETQLIEDLRWLDLSWDEGPAANGEKGQFGPYRQSDRLAIYAEHTARLLTEQKAYRCFCTVEQLEADRAHALATHAPQNYRGRCRGIAPAESARRADSGEPFAVRLAIPDRPLRFTDIVPVRLSLRLTRFPTRSSCAPDGRVSGRARL